MNFKTTDDLLNFAKEIEKTLTPQEQNVISYHRKNMDLVLLCCFLFLRKD